MKKRFLNLMLFPFLLVGCAEPEIKGTVNGEAFTSGKKAQIADVTDEKKNEVTQDVGSSFHVKGRSYVLVEAKGASRLETKMNLDIDVNIASPALNLAIDGSLYANVLGMGATTGIRGSSQVRKNNDNWEIVNDYIKYGDDSEQTFFSGSASFVSDYFDEIVNNLYSWGYEFDPLLLDFSKITDYTEETPESVQSSLLSIFAIDGDIEQGNFEVGIKTPYEFLSSEETDNFIRVSKLRVAYEDYLLKEQVFKIESHYVDEDNAMELDIITENSFQYIYN